MLTTFKWGAHKIHLLENCCRATGMVFVFEIMGQICVSTPLHVSLFDISLYLFIHFFGISNGFHRKVFAHMQNIIRSHRTRIEFNRFDGKTIDIKIFPDAWEMLADD